MFSHFVSELGERLGGALLRFGAWVYIRTSSDAIRIVITIEEADEADDSEALAPGVDPVYVQWLNQLYDSDSASGP